MPRHRAPVRRWDLLLDQSRKVAQGSCFASFANAARSASACTREADESGSCSLSSTLRPGGLLIGLTNPFRRDVIAAKAQAARVRGTTSMVMPDHTALDHLARLADAGQLRPVVAETFPSPTSPRRTSSESVAAPPASSS
jgi:hypothetical protein